MNDENISREFKIDYMWYKTNMCNNIIVYLILIIKY